MVLEKLPKIMKIDGGEKSLESPEIMLDNYKVAAFFFENTEGKNLTVKINADTEGGKKEAVPFLFKKVEDGTEYEKVDAEGKTFTDGGAFIAVVTADSLSHKEFDRVSINLTCDDNLTTVYAMQTQPRYTENV